MLQHNSRVYIFRRRHTLDLDASDDDIPQLPEINPIDVQNVLNQELPILNQFVEPNQGVLVPVAPEAVLDEPFLNNDLIEEQLERCTIRSYFSCN